SSQPLGDTLLDLDRSTNKSQFNLQWNFDRQDMSGYDAAIVWLLRVIGIYLDNAFFFNPFRHSTSSLGVTELRKLSQTGENLAQVLFTLRNNEPRIFEQIKQFVEEAVPDIGTLLPVLRGSATEVHFEIDNQYRVRLHDMGGGIEQLLMIATV